MEFLPSTTTMVVWLLRIYTTLSEVIVSTKDVSVKILTGVLTAFDKHEYYFMQGYVVPYLRTSVNEYASSSAKVEWIYTVEDKQFTAYGQQGLPVGASLPILSLEIVRDDSVAYDLTDFVETMVVIRSDDAAPSFPSISQIVQAWVLHSKIVFDVRIEFAARVITTNGDTVVLELDDGRDLGRVVEEEAAAEAEESSDGSGDQEQASPNVQEVRKMAQEAMAAADNAIGRMREASAAVEDAIRG
jgi:hypothetical protein